MVPDGPSSDAEVWVAVQIFFAEKNSDTVTFTASCVWLKAVLDTNERWSIECKFGVEFGDFVFRSRDCFFDSQPWDVRTESRDLFQVISRNPFSIVGCSCVRRISVIFCLWIIQGWLCNRLRVEWSVLFNLLSSLHFALQPCFALVNHLHALSGPEASSITPWRTSVRALDCSRLILAVNYPRHHLPLWRTNTLVCNPTALQATIIPPSATNTPRIRIQPGTSSLNWVESCLKLR